MMKAPNKPLMIIGLATSIVPSAALFCMVTYLFLIPLIGGLVLLIASFILAKPKTQRSLKIGVFFAIVLWIGPFLFITYAERSGSPLLFVLPQHYRGSVDIVLDLRQGEDVPVVDGKRIIRIPPNGIFYLRKDDFMHRWHEEQAQYEDGTPVPNGDLIRVTQDQIGFFSFGAHVQNLSDGKQEIKYLFFIGTEEEADKVRPK